MPIYVPMLLACVHIGVRELEYVAELAGRGGKVPWRCGEFANNKINVWQYSNS